MSPIFKKGLTKLGDDDRKKILDTGFLFASGNCSKEEQREMVVKSYQELKEQYHGMTPMQENVNRNYMILHELLAATFERERSN